MQTHEVSVDTTDRTVVDVTSYLREFCLDQLARGSGHGAGGDRIGGHGAGGDGLVNVFAPHATAGLALMETDSGSEADLDEVVARLLPRDDRWSHRHGSPGHGADHVLPVFISPSVTVPVRDGEPLLGTWQRLVLVDYNADNHRRRLRLSFVGDRS